MACFALKSLCLNYLNCIQFCFPIYLNFNKKYDVMQNFLLKDLQSQTKVVGILPPNAVFLLFFFLLACPLVLQTLFNAEFFIKRPTVSDKSSWDTSTQRCFLVVFFSFWPVPSSYKRCLSQLIHQSCTPTFGRERR